MHTSEHLGTLPATARKTFENPDRTIRVYSRKQMRKAARSHSDPADWLREALTATIRIRWTDTRCYALTIRHPANDHGLWSYDYAGGYGYDKTAAALSGHEIKGGPESACLNDHSHGPNIIGYGETLNHPDLFTVG